jgi:hypothetical protein
MSSINFIFFLLRLLFILHHVQLIN